MSNKIKAVLSILTFCGVLFGFCGSADARMVMTTAYTPHEQAGYMANGLWIQEGYVALDFLPLGTQVWLDGVPYIVGDRIGSGDYNHVDIVMNSYEDAIQHGRRYMNLQY